MGLLSKIFNTDKLSYILREDLDVFGGDEDDSTLLSKIGITKLKVGDRITPDMWDKQKIEDLNTSNFRIIYDEIIQDSYLIKDINSYEDYDDEAGWFVDLRDKNNNSWGIIGAPEELNFLNSVLKPQYQIIEPINESDTFGGDEDDTSLMSKIGVTKLGVGDTITPDMINHNDTTGNSISLENMFKRSLGEVEIIGINNKEFNIDHVTVGYIENYTGDYREQYWDLDSLNHALNPKYQIIEPINESEDVFGGDEEESDFLSRLSLTKLTVGDKITPDMWDIGTTSMNGFKFPDDFRDVDLNGPYTIETIEKSTVHGTPYVRIVNGEDTQGWDMNILNSVLKPQYQIVSPVTESTDTFGGDEDETDFLSRLSRTGLTIGDTITPDMVDTSESSNVIRRWFMEPSEITGVFENDISDWLVRLTDTETSIVIYLDYLNSILDPRYQITTYENLRENDTFGGDEDDSSLLNKIGITRLTVGDEITPDMFSDDDFPFWKWEGFQDFTISYYGNDGHKDYIKLDYIKNGLKTSTLVYVDIMNDKVLEPGYIVVPPMTESLDTFGGDEDESDFLSRLTINKLKVGDIITPDMWSDRGYLDASTDALITDIGTSDGIPYVTLEFPSGMADDWRLDIINKSLQSRFQVASPDDLNESDDTFGGDEDDTEFLSRLTQYTGDVVLTFEIYMDGYLYLRDIDIEPFKKLNPNIDMDFENDVIYANTTWKTSPVSIETIREFMQDEWGKELGPFTGPRTTRDFIHWLESTGEYSGEIISSMYFPELKEVNTEYWIDQDGEQFVKLTPEMEKLKDYYEETGGVNLLNVDFTSSLKESEDVFGDEGDDTDFLSRLVLNPLTKGDEITPDMWDEKAVVDAGEEDEFLNGETWTITDIVSRYMTLSSDGGGFIDWPIEDVQSLLKPQFKIVTGVNEQDTFGGDEDDIEFLQKLSTNRVTTGDTFNIGNNTYIIGNFDIDGRHVGVKKKGSNKELIFPITLVQSKLPPNTILVKPTPKLSELLR